MFSIKSPIFEASLDSLRPTQMTVGFKEVESKRKSWSKLKGADRKKQMREELFPVVKGPKGLLYVLDHHHAALALIQEGADQVQAGMVKDLQHLSRDAFWTYLDHFSWMHVYDAKGRKCSSDEMPARFEDMLDDPFRSFSGDVRDAGGFSKPRRAIPRIFVGELFPRRVLEQSNCTRRSHRQSSQVGKDRQGCAFARLVRPKVRDFPSLQTLRFEQWIYLKICSAAALI